MLATLLSIIVLFLSWTISYLIAVPTAYLVRSTGLVNIPVFRVFRPNSRRGARQRDAQVVLCRNYYRAGHLSFPLLPMPNLHHNC